MPWPRWDALAQQVGRPKETLWTMRNGYALGTRDGLNVISEFLADASDEEREALRGELAIGCTRTSRSPMCRTAE